MAEPIAHSAAGSVAGLRIGDVSQFRGIPYAAPPVGADRFAAPRPAVPWRGVRDATAFGPASPQQQISAGLLIPDAARELRADKSEDCLCLNVTSPDPTPGASLPVMVYIHGGNFVEGAGSQAWSAPASLS